MCKKGKKHGKKISRIGKRTYLREEVSRCESIEELRERILPILQSQKAQWSRKIHEIITESGLNKSAFAELCGVSRMAVNKWCNGSIPKNRETFIALGCLQDMTEKRWISFYKDMVNILLYILRAWRIVFVSLC